MVIDRIPDNAGRDARTWKMPGRVWVHRACPIGMHLPVVVTRTLYRIDLRTRHYAGSTCADSDRRNR
jgi:hypothetical protein